MQMCRCPLAASGGGVKCLGQSETGGHRRQDRGALTYHPKHHSVSTQIVSLTLLGLGGPEGTLSQ
jgi:hypothetical protein